jgi:hypothetical protein
MGFEDCYNLLTTPNGDTHGKGSLMEWFHENLTPRKEQRDTFGEVFTPMYLVKEMLDHVPDTFWRNPNVKLLDPASGYGQFSVYAYCKLFNGLATVRGFRDPKKRRDHIIKHMLFMIELQPESSRILKKIFGSTANVISCSFIPGEYSRVFNESCEFKDGSRSFDLIMGNPPYNSGSIRSASRNVKGPQEIVSKTIWPMFISRAIEHLEHGGYLSLVNPLGMVKPVGVQSMMYEFIMNNFTPLYIHTMNSRESKKVFSGSGIIPIISYVFQYTSPKAKQSIKVYEGSNEKPFILRSKPVLIGPDHNKIIHKVYSKFGIIPRDFIQTSSGKVPTGTKYPIIKKFIDQGGNSYIRYVKSSNKIPTDLFDVPKLVVSTYAVKGLRFYYDKKGEVGASDFDLFIIHDSKIIKKYYKYLQTKFASFLFNRIKYRQEYGEGRLLPDISHLPISKIHDEALMDLVNFTEREKEEVRSSKVYSLEYSRSQFKTGRKTRKIRKK